jgi:hypothetical protein
MNDCCAISVIVACDQKDQLIARLNAQLAALDPEPVAVVKAERDSALDAAADLLAILRRDGGFRTARQQSTIRGVVALLSEHGRSVRGQEQVWWENREVVR